MRIKIEQFLFGANHSWALVGKSIARELLALGHSIELISTDGILPEYLPSDLAPFRRKAPSGAYDAQFSYTAMFNFARFLKSGSTNRWGMWAYEWPLMPPEFVKYHQSADFVLVPSQWCQENFVSQKIPASKVKVIPHGITLDNFQSKEKFPLKTSKSVKILMDLGQAHLRKNIAGALKAFGKAFSKSDDVCLVAKIHQKPIKHQFDVDVRKLFQDFRQEFPQHAEIELITQYVPNIIELYNACDIVYTLSFAEGFYMPGLNALATGKLNIAPRYGGQLDFLNDENSLLVEGKVIRAHPKMQYWSPNLHNTCFDADLDDAVSKLRAGVANPQPKASTFEISDWTWNTQVKKILELSK